MLPKSFRSPTLQQHVPSIVVHNGSTDQPPGMERSARPQRTLSKQAEFHQDDEVKPTFPVEKEQETETVSENSSGIPQSSSTSNRIPDRSRSKVKLLVRSHAVREETSPPPDPPESPTSNANDNTPSNNNNHVYGNCLSVNVPQHKLKREGSSQGSMDSNWSTCLSGGSSFDQYTDASGVDLEQFIAETLNKNQKDKMLLLKIEQELVCLIKDPKRSVHKFPSMSSYQRMLVHRVAAYFGMEHNVDPSGHQVVVNKSKSTRLPDSRFSDLISSIYTDDLLFPEELRRSILKRDSSSFDETTGFKSHYRQLGCDTRRSKSFEEREEEYEKARRRIFNREHGYSQSSSQDEGDVRWTSSESEHLPLTEATSHENRKARMLKVESYESKDTLRANSLISISKSFSFGGYDQSSLNTRILTKQDSGSSMSSRLSPSSSGYKSQSQRSDVTLSATPSPSATPHLTTQLSSQSRVSSPEPETDRTVMWAVTSMALVPPGSILINPKTGQPYTNSDGSIYHYDPENPPKISSEEENQPVPQSPPSVKPFTRIPSDKTDLKKKPPPKNLHTTPQTSVPSCTETANSLQSSATFSDKSSHSFTSQTAPCEQTKVTSRIQSNNHLTVRPRRAQLSHQHQKTPTSQIPYHQPQPFYPQPGFPTMGSCNIVLQPVGLAPEGFYPANSQQQQQQQQQQQLVYTPPVLLPAGYNPRVNISPNICPQYPMYSNAYGMGGCYPLPYTHTTNPPVMVQPNVQLVPRASPPSRAYGTNLGPSRSPGIRERSAAVCPGTLNWPNHTHMPFYETRLISGYILGP